MERKRQKERGRRKQGEPATGAMVVIVFGP